MFLLLLALFFSCKKVEDKFPVGHYQFDIQTNEVDNENETWEAISPARVVSSSENLLRIESYSINILGDTIYGEISDFGIASNDIVSGVISSAVSEVTFSEGEISKRSKNDYTIEGNVSAKFWIDAGESSYWRYYLGTFSFEDKN